jgi:hypothetical protein
VHSPADNVFLPSRVPIHSNNEAQPKKHKLLAQISYPICDSDSDEYRGPDSSSKGEGGWEGQPGVSLQPDRIVTRTIVKLVTRRTPNERTPPITDKIEIPRQCPLLEVPLHMLHRSVRSLLSLRQAIFQRPGQRSEWLEFTAGESITWRTIYEKRIIWTKKDKIMK